MPLRKIENATPAQILILARPMSVRPKAALIHKGTRARFGAAASTVNGKLQKTKPKLIIRAMAAVEVAIAMGVAAVVIETTIEAKAAAVKAAVAEVTGIGKRSGRTVISTRISMRR